MSSTDATIGSENTLPSTEAANHHNNAELVKSLLRISHQIDGHTALATVERDLQQRRLIRHRPSRH